MSIFEGMDITVNSLTFGILGAANSGASSYSGIILILLMIALMYFFMIRPQQKQRKQHQDMMSNLHPGDEVVTIGRLHGKIDSINQADRTVTLDCEGIYLTFDMVAIARVVKAKSNDNAAAAQPAASDAPASSAESAQPAESAEPADDDKTADSAASQADDQEK
jgi:preprotein translocase subunit YajC